MHVVGNGSVGLMQHRVQQESSPLPSEERTARLSVLIDPRKKACFEALCKQEDVTPSQVVRQLIRDFIEARMGPNWQEQVLGSGPEADG